MARRHGSGQDLGLVGEAGYRLFERLPEWVGFAVPFGLFFAIQFAGNALLNVLSPVASLAHQVWGIAIVPLIALAAALITFEMALITYFIRIGRFKLLKLAESKPAFRSMNSRDFERLVGAMYERQGNRVEYAGVGADGGYDLVLHKESERLLVQCKQKPWTGVAEIRELFGVLIDERADSAVLVASGMFSDQARDFANGKKLDLIDGTKLLKMIEAVHESEPAAAQI